MKVYVFEGLFLYTNKNSLRILYFSGCNNLLRGTTYITFFSKDLLLITISAQKSEIIG